MKSSEGKGGSDRTPRSIKGGARRPQIATPIKSEKGAPPKKDGKK